VFSKFKYPAAQVKPMIENDAAIVAGGPLAIYGRRRAINKPESAFCRFSNSDSLVG
jgi:hypothetical protein